LRLEQLEDRVVPTVIDLTNPGGPPGALYGALFYQFTQHPAGSGVFSSFARLATNNTVEQGYNTDSRPVQFDEQTSSSFTHSLQLKSVPIVIAGGGLAYYEFLLDINQLSSQSLLSEDELRLYVTNSSTVDPTLLHGYNTSTHTLQDDTGHLYSPAYDLNPVSAAANYIKMDANLSSGNGSGDMVALIPVTALGTDPNQYVYLYSEFGVHFANNDGYDEWATGNALPVGTISGLKFLDVNGNGAQDSGEPGLAGVTVFLDANNNGMLDPGEVSTVTASDGSFSFSNVVAGTYHVREVIPPGSIQTAQINADVNLASAQNFTGVAFGNFKLGSISGTKFEDTTGNGFSVDDPILNTANPHYVSVTINLFKSGVLVASTATDANGNYVFNNLGPGTYTVSETVPSGWVQTAATGGSITLLSGTAVTSNFDDFKLGTISGTKFADTTGDGFSVDDTVFGSSDPHFVPVTMQLFNGSNPNPVATTTTGSDGTYTFTGVGPGTYTVAEVKPRGWIQTAATGATITATSGFASTANNFDNFLVAYLSGSILVVRTTLTGSGTLTLFQNPSTSNIDVSESTASLASQSAGSFPVASISTIQITSNRGYTVDSSQVNTLPVVDAIQPGDNNLVGGSSGTTVLLNNGSTDTISVTGGINTLNFSPTAFGVTFNAGMVQGQLQPLDPLSQHFLGVTGTFQTIVGTSFSDTLTAALPTFNSGVIGPGTTIFSGLGQDTIYGTLGTKAQTDGGSSSYTQVLSSAAISELQSAISMFGGSTADLGGFSSSVTMNGDLSNVNISLLTNVTVNGSQNTINQAFDASSAQALQSALASFGDSTGNLGGFGGSVDVKGGFNAINISALANLNMSSGTNTVVQSFDPNAAQVLNTIIAGFGNQATTPGGFGQDLKTVGGYGGSIAETGGFNQIQTTLLASVSLGGGTNTYIQTVDANASQVLTAAIQNLQMHYGSSPGNQGGFGGLLDTLGGLANFVTATSGTNTFGTSILTNVAVSGGNTTYVQSLDANSAQVLETAIAAFGAGVNSGIGGFGESLGTPGGFGDSLQVAGGLNQVQTSLMTSVNFGGDNNTYIQSLDAYSAQVLEAAIAGFGSHGATQGGFGNGLNELGGFGNSIDSGGNGFNKIRTSILTNITLNGSNNLYLQALDDNSRQVLDAAIAGFGGSVNGGIGGFGDSLATQGGFGDLLKTTGGYNEVETSVLTAVNFGGGNNIYFQFLDNNSAQVLETAIAHFGSHGANQGGFGADLNDLGGFGDSVKITGGFNQLETSILSTVSISGGNNLYIQTLDNNSTTVLDQAIASYGSQLGSGVGGFGNPITEAGGFGNSIAVTIGGFNNIQVSLLTNVTMGGGDNLYTQNLDVNSVQVLNTAVATIASFGGTPSVIGGFGNNGDVGGGYNTAHAGLLTTVHLSGGFDTFVEQLTADEISVAATALANAPSQGQAAVAQSIGLAAFLGDGDDVIVGGLLGTFSAGIGNDRFVIEDPSLLGAPNVNSQLLQFGGAFTGSTGSNTFYLVGGNVALFGNAALFGHVAITEPAANSDTLDLSSIQVAGPILDLSTSSEQQVLPGNLWLTLTAPNGFSFLVGNGNGVTLKAGTRNVTLEGAAPLDPRAINPPAWQGSTQYVFLDFVTYTTGTKHVYTDQERSQILSQLQSDYAAFPFVKFTLDASTIPANTLYETEFFNRTPPGNEPGGNSSEIDFRNLNLADFTEIDVNGFLGGSGQPAATSANYVAVSATIAAHELGHTMGMTHPDSYGPIGFGLHNPPGVTTYLPAYPGPQAAWETPLHIIASPASVGSTLFDATANPFFGAREDIKLAFIQGGTVVNEQLNPDGTNYNVSRAMAQPLNLYALQVPDTALKGFDAGKILSVTAVDVTNASIQLDKNTGLSQSDWYSFQGQAGDLINIQTLSHYLNRITDPVDTILRVYDSSGTLLSYYTSQASNDDNFETADAVIEDLKLPSTSTGTFFIEVDSYAASPATDTATGHYELFIYRFQEGNTTPTGGSNSTFIVGPGQDTILGRGGHDTVKDSGAANYVLTNTSLTGTGTASLTGITTAILTGAAGGTTFDLSGWTGTATVIGVGGINTLIVNRDANFTLTNGTLTLSDGTVINLVNIQKVLLTGGPSANSFDVGGWTTGTVVLDGAGGTNTVIASRGAASFVLTNSSLVISGGGTISFSNIQNAALTGAANGTTFDVRNWSGTDTLKNSGGANPVYTPHGIAVNATEGVSQTVGTATFTDQGVPVATNYTASFDWGDGTTSLGGTGSASGSTLTINGSHAFKDEGTYTVTTTFSQGALFSVIVNSTAKVVDAPLTASSSQVNMPLYLSVPNTQLAKFTDANSFGLISDFTANVSWGDGTSSTGVVSQPGGTGTSFVVSAGHFYGITGNYSVTVNITDVGGQTASTSFTVAVQPSIFVLNPTASGALTLTGSVAINIGGAVIVDSSSTTALSAGGTTQITAGTIQVVGGVSASNGAILSPTPVTGIKAIADPLMGLPVPPNATNQGAVNLSKGSMTINPGVYSQIKVSGTGTTLTMNPGVYIIAGGGFSVSNSANVMGTGVMIYNTGSNFPNAGGTFGAISLGSSGNIALSGPTSGTYAGILIFQARDNTRAISLNAKSVVGLNGTIYAPAALLSLGGSATWKTPAIVGSLSLSGNGGTALTAAGTDNSTAGTAGQLLGGDLFLYVNDPSGFFTSDELARVADTISGLDNLLGPYSVTITEVSDATLANLVLDTGSTSAAGGLADGVLGCFISDGTTGEITLIQGWNWYTGADPTLIGSDQYDFQTILTHEMGHALGLGHSSNPDSVMYAELATGVAHWTMTVQDLNIQDTGVGPDGLHAAPSLVEMKGVSFVQSQGVNRSSLTIVAPAPTDTSASITGFGFILADLSGTSSLATNELSKASDTPAYETRENAFWSDPVQTIGLGDILPGIDFQASTTPSHENKTPLNSKPSASDPSLDHHREGQPEESRPGDPVPRPSDQPPTERLWENLSSGHLDAESTQLNHFGSMGDSEFWDLDERLSWLFLGMFLIPTSDAGRENKQDDNSPKRKRVGPF
jgi:hypothetical protein